MIIEKINIKSFGMLRDMSMEFSDSVNVIEGQNEAGKSTLAAFIKYMLYGFEGVDSEECISERRKRVNWDTGRAEGSMIVRVRGRRYLINRTTVLVDPSAPRGTYKEDCAIVDLETGTPAFGKSPAGEVFFGVTRELFENTAFVGALDDARIAEQTVKESIENILFSGSERLSSQKAAVKIRDKMEALLHKTGMGGAIFELEQKKQALEEELSKTNEANHLILAKEAELHEIRERRNAAEKKRNNLYELDACYKNVMLIRSFDKLHDTEKEFEQRSEALSEFLDANTRNHYVPTPEYLTDLAVARRSVTDTYRRMIQTREHYSERKNAVGITAGIEQAIALSDMAGGEAAVLQESASLRKKKMKGLAFACAGGLVALFGIVAQIVATGALAKIWPRIGLGALALGGVILGVYALLGLRKSIDRQKALCEKFGTQNAEELAAKIAVIAENRRKRDDILQSTEDAKTAAEEAKRDYDEAKKELTGVILRWGEEPPTSGLNEFLDRLEARTSAFLEQKNRLTEEKSRVEMLMKEIRRSLSDTSEIDIRARVSPLKRKALTDVNHQEILEGIETCKTEIETQDVKSAEVENELAALKLRARDPGELLTKIQTLDAQIAKLRLHHKAYYIAHEAVVSAADNLREEISPRLGTYATHLMEIMTKKKYTSLDISEGMRVTFKNANGETRSADFLSGGTQDMTYIAVRMALIDMLYTENPPVCFDESFAHQDNVRASGMMDAIRYLSEEEGRQSFIFTCRARETALATENIAGAGIYKLEARDLIG